MAFGQNGFTFVDLFAGVGGFHHALQSMGGKCVLAVEQDPACRKVYEIAFPGTPIVGDIRSLTKNEGGKDLDAKLVDEMVPDHDVLCAGFPCQPFSKSGYQQGTRDKTRGTLFFDVMTIVFAKRPRFIILENVRNLAGPRHADTWGTIIESLREANYKVASEPLVFSPHLLSPESGGSPQIRDRVFILASRLEGGSEDDRVGQPLAKREATPGWGPDRWRVEEYLDADDEIPNLKDYQLRDEEIGWIEAWEYFVQMVPSDDLPGFPIWVDEFRLRPRVTLSTPPWKANFLRKNSDFYRAYRESIDEWLRMRWGPLGQRVRDFPVSRRKFEWQARSWQPKKVDRTLFDLVLQMRPSGIRVKPPTYLPALVAIAQTSIIGSRMRTITPVEAARLQMIPFEPFVEAEIPDSSVYKQLGNAVNVGVVRHMARLLFGERADFRIDELVS
jgi:DNA (cytosine-5)-methyltransferase 1